MQELTRLSLEKNTANLFARIIILLIFLIPLFISSCEDQRLQTVTWTEYEPVYMSHGEFTSAVAMEEPRVMNDPGKIYFYDEYLFINEVNKGVHIIDNRNPAAPSHLGFVNIPANKDIAVKDDLLYADSHSDLLVFDITDIQKAEMVSRKEGVFEFSANKQRGFPYQSVDHSKGVVVDWKPVEVEDVCRGNCHNYGWTTIADGSFFSQETSAGGKTGAGASGGAGGSMARFAIAGNYMYAVDDRNLITFDITSPVPDLKDRKDVGWAIETIFPHENNLYIGSESAMYIFDIANPAAPVQLSIYSHLTACDPVVVEGKFAYVTLREGERCPRGVNRLEVIDVEDPFSPKKIAFYEMINPHGLGIDDGYLFISEGDNGLKIMDATDPYEIKQLRHITDIKTYDVIPFNKVLMVTGDDGILQYDYSDINNVEHLSTIPVINEE